MDDDVRIDNHGIVKDFCYCPKCIEKYNERYGKNYTFADIKEKWDKDETLRETWKDSAYLTMSNMVAAIHDAVKSVNPQIEIGFMSGTKNCVPEWIEASHAKKADRVAVIITTPILLNFLKRALQYRCRLCHIRKT